MLPTLMVLAGCSGSSHHTGLMAEQFAGCHLKYPDNSTLACRDTDIAAAYDVHPTKAPWVCRSRPTDNDTRFAWYDNLVDGSYAIQANVTAWSGPIQGLITFTGNTRTPTIWRWSSSEPYAWIQDFQGNPQGAVFENIEAHQIHVTTNGSAFANASSSELWSLYGERPWLVVEVRTDGKLYHFSHMRAMGNDAYEPESFTVDGGDFHLTVDMKSTGLHSFTNGKVPYTSCPLSP